MKTARFKVAVVLGVLALLVAPALSFAATYAYVNTAGEVMTVEASSADQALLTAPGLHIHSGVILVNDAQDESLKGDKVAI